MQPMQPMGQLAVTYAACQEIPELAHAAGRWRRWRASCLIRLKPKLSTISAARSCSCLCACSAQVAILCNHQRSVPKGHAGQMEKMEGKLLKANEELQTLQDKLRAAKAGKPYKGNGKNYNQATCALLPLA